jgi:hypothetical protein
VLHVNLLSIYSFFYIISSSQGSFNSIFFLCTSFQGLVISFLFLPIPLLLPVNFYIKICFSSIWQGAVIKIFLMPECINLPLQFKMVLCLCQWRNISSFTWNGSQTCRRQEFIFYNGSSSLSEMSTFFLVCWPCSEHPLYVRSTQSLGWECNSYRRWN